MMNITENKETNRIGYKIFTLRSENDTGVYVVELSSSAEKFLEFLIETELYNGFSCDDGNTTETHRF